MLLRSTRDRGDAERTWCRQVRVRVAGGYVPSTIRADAGRPLRLIFCREESSACSEQLVLPAFGKSVTLLRGEAVAVDLPAMGPGEYEFIDGIGHAARPTPRHPFGAGWAGSSVSPAGEARSVWNATVPELDVARRSPGRVSWLLIYGYPVVVYLPR